MDPPIANLHLSMEEDKEIVLDVRSIPDSNTAIKLCLVGRFLTDQPINFNSMKSRMASIWRPGKGVFIKEIGHGRTSSNYFILFI